MPQTNLMKHGKDRKLWVVEMLTVESKWYPTVGVATTQEEGLMELRLWRGKNPDDKFRLEPYSRGC